MYYDIRKLISQLTIRLFKTKQNKTKVTLFFLNFSLLYSLQQFGKCKVLTLLQYFSEHRFQSFDFFFFELIILLKSINFLILFYMFATCQLYQIYFRFYKNSK
jgi:hypothetical protein